MNNIPDQLVWFFIGGVISYLFTRFAPSIKKRWLIFTHKMVQVQDLGHSFSVKTFLTALEKSRAKIYSTSETRTFWLIKDDDQIRLVFKIPGRNFEFFYVACSIDTFLAKYKHNNGSKSRRVLMAITTLINNGNVTDRKDFKTKQAALQMLKW